MRASSPVVFVAGAGLTGCLTALALKRDRPEARVVVWEKNLRTGGVCLPWDGQGPDFLSMFPDPNPLAAGFGLSVPVEPLQDLYEIGVRDPGGPGVRFRAGLGPGGFLDSLAGRFPGEARALGRFWAGCRTLEDEFFRLKSRFSLADLAGLPFACPNLLGALGRSWEGWLGTFGFRDPALLDALRVLSLTANLPADRAAAPAAALALVGLVRNGVRPGPGFGAWLGGLGAELFRRGIELETGTKLVRLSRASGGFRAESAGGRVLFCHEAVSTIDTRAFLGALGPDLARALGRSYRKPLEMSPGFVLWRAEAGLDPGPVPGQILGRTASGRSWALTVRPGTARGSWCWDVLLAPEPGARWVALARDRGSWGRTLAGLEAEILGALELRFPGFGARAGSRRWFTPPGFGAAFGLWEGSMDDLAQTPAQAGARRPGFATGIRGLSHLKLMHGVLGAFFQASVFADWRSGGRRNGFRYPVSYGPGPGSREPAGEMPYTF